MNHIDVEKSAIIAIKQANIIRQGFVAGSWDNLNSKDFIGFFELSAKAFYGFLTADQEDGTLAEREAAVEICVGNILAVLQRKEKKLLSSQEAAKLLSLDEIEVSLQDQLNMIRAIQVDQFEQSIKLSVVPNTPKAPAGGRAKI